MWHVIDVLTANYSKIVVKYRLFIILYHLKRMKRDRKEESHQSGKRSKKGEDKHSNVWYVYSSPDPKSEKRKEEERLSALVRDSNAKEMEKAEHIMFNDIPNKIKELTEFIRVPLNIQNSFLERNFVSSIFWRNPGSCLYSQGETWENCKKA